jgi:Holliday junction resolvasome RuvABC DNA-binding subunit
VIASLMGTVAGMRNDGTVLLAVGPLSLELQLPPSQARELAAGEEVELFTHLYFSSAADALRLYGFTSPTARDLFALLITASPCSNSAWRGWWRRCRARTSAR